MGFYRAAYGRINFILLLALLLSSLFLAGYFPYAVWSYTTPQDLKIFPTIFIMMLSFE
jgi:hypothetical protein